MKHKKNTETKIRAVVYEFSFFGDNPVYPWKH